MKTIQQLQLDALDRIGGALADLEKLTNPFDIEAKVYFIKQLAEQSFQAMHKANSSFHTDHPAARPEVFESIFGKGIRS